MVSSNTLSLPLSFCVSGILGPAWPGGWRAGGDTGLESQEAVRGGSAGHGGGRGGLQGIERPAGHREAGSVQGPR